MDLPTQLASDINALFDRVAGEPEDLHEALDGVRRALASAVPSYCSLSLVLIGDTRTVQLDVVEPTAPPAVVTSLQVPLDDDGFGTGSALMIFAATAGALVDLAADLAYARPSTPLIVLDRHLDRAPTTSQLTGVMESSLADQAVGVLITDGLTPDEAEVELARLAKEGECSVQQAAQLVLARSQRCGQDQAERQPGG